MRRSHYFFPRRILSAPTTPPKPDSRLLVNGPGWCASSLPLCVVAQKGVFSPNCPPKSICICIRSLRLRLISICDSSWAALSMEHCFLHHKLSFVRGHFWNAVQNFELSVSSGFAASQVIDGPLCCLKNRPKVLHTIQYQQMMRIISALMGG